MEWQAKWEEPRPRYLQRFDELLGDVRTRRTFQASIKALKTSGVRGKQAICGGGRRGCAAPPWKGVGAVAPHLPHARSARCQ